MTNKKNTTFQGSFSYGVYVSPEHLAKVSHSVIPGRASLARNDDFFLLS
jgi:hypothetical protein